MSQPLRLHAAVHGLARVSRALPDVAVWAVRLAEQLAASRDDPRLPTEAARLGLLEAVLACYLVSADRGTVLASVSCGAL